MSVAAYIKQERLNAAKKLIVETSRPINVIARECGYGALVACPSTPVTSARERSRFCRYSA